jgi:hypothetical protein
MILLFQINWFDQNGNLISDASYQSKRMANSKLFEAYSVVSFTPTKDHNNVSLKCQVNSSLLSLHQHLDS